MESVNSRHGRATVTSRQVALSLANPGPKRRGPRPGEEITSHREAFILRSREERAIQDALRFW